MTSRSNVPHDQVVALLGGNGAGKTTLLRTLSGIVKPRRGRIEFDGVSIAGLPPRSIVTRGLVQVPQGRFVWPGMTVLDNLLLGAVTRHDKAEVRASVDDAFMLFPTLHRRQADRAGLLSGGEQQMLAIARALMAKPRMLLLDEPSAGLSPRIIGEMVDALRALHQRGLGDAAGGTECRPGGRIGQHGLRAGQRRHRIRNGRRKPGVQSANHPQLPGTITEPVHAMGRH